MLIGRVYRYDKSQNTTPKNALHALRESANLQPRNQYGGYWFYTYPNWSYLDGTYSLLPFLVDYTQRFDTGNATAVAGDVVHQLDLLWAHCQDRNTASNDGNGSGMLVHGYDSTKKASWANPATGGSPYVWSRSLGWYFMALVDVFDIMRSHDIFPSELKSYIRQRFTELAKAILSAADKDNGCWWQVVTLPHAKGNYIETSGSGMLVYGLLKGSRLGLLSPEGEYTSVAEKCYDHMLRDYVVYEGDGLLGFNGTVGVCSLNSSATYEVCSYPYPNRERCGANRCSIMSMSRWLITACTGSRRSHWRVWSMKCGLINSYYERLMFNKSTMHRAWT